jgi:hypothetical protein
MEPKRRSSEEDIPQLYTKGALESLIMMSPEQLKIFEEGIPLSSVELLENTKEERKERKERKEILQDQDMKQTDKTLFLMKKGIESFIYTTVVQLLNNLPTLSTIGSFGPAYPFISLLSHLTATTLTNQFFCKSSLKELGFSETISKFICLIIEYFIYYYMLFGITNMVFMYFLAPTPSTLEFFIQYSKDLRGLFKDIYQEFNGCADNAIKEVLKFQGKGAGYEFVLAKKAWNDIQKINEKDILKTIDQASNYAVSFATNIGLLGYAKDLESYKKKIIETTQYFLPKSTGTMAYLGNIFFSVGSYFVDSGIAESAIKNKPEFLKNVTNPFQKNSTSLSVVSNDLNKIFKEIEFPKNFDKLDTDLETQFQIAKFGETMMKMVTPNEKEPSILDLLFINQKKISGTGFEDLNNYILSNTLKGSIDLIANLQESKFEIIREVSNTVSLNNCTNSIYLKLIDFNNKVANKVKLYDSVDLNPQNNDLFRFMKKYDVQISNPYYIKPKNVSNIVLMDYTQSQLKKDLEYITIGTYNVASIIMFFIVIFLFFIKIIAIIKRFRR